MSKNLHFGYDDHDPTPKQEAISPGRDSIESEDERGKLITFHCIE